MLIRNLNQLLHLPSPLPYLLSCTDKPPAGPPRFILSLLVNKILRYDDLRSRCCWLTKFPSLRVRSSRRDINWINQLIQQWARVGVICVSTDSSAETLHYNASTLHADFKRTRHQEPCQLQKSRGTILRLPKQTARRWATPIVQHGLKMTFDFAPQITHLLVTPGLLCVVCKHYCTAKRRRS